MNVDSEILKISQNIVKWAKQSNIRSPESKDSQKLEIIQTDADNETETK